MPSLELKGEHLRPAVLGRPEKTLQRSTEEFRLNRSNTVQSLS